MIDRAGSSSSCSAWIFDFDVPVEGRFDAFIRQRSLIHYKAVLAPRRPHVDEHGFLLALCHHQTRYQ